MSDFHEMVDLDKQMVTRLQNISIQVQEEPLGVGENLFPGTVLTAHPKATLYLTGCRIRGIVCFWRTPSPNPDRN